MTAIRFRATVSVLVLVLFVAVFYSGLQSPCLKPPSVGELTTTTGGACYTCTNDDYCKTCSKPCKELQPPGCGVYRKWVAGGITQKFCWDLEKFGPPGAGKRACSTSDYQVCVTIYECTDSSCNNCGDPATEEKPTVCTPTGDTCTVE